MRRLEVRLTHGPGSVLPVGELAERDGRVYFEFAEEFLDREWELSPWKLPAAPGLIEHVDHTFGPLPGVFDDSLPDGWGRLVMDRRFERLGLEPRSVSSLERLAVVGTRTMGALTYHPPADGETEPVLVRLEELARNAAEVLRGEANEVLPLLERTGGSPGGARPKVLVGVRDDEILSGEEDLPEGFAHWMVKFPAREDPLDIGALEEAYAVLARRAGIEMSETRLFRVRGGASFFGTRRFDRAEGNRRFHVHTLGNLIHSDFRVPGCDYDHLFRVARGLTHDQRAVTACFRRMVFNLGAANRDDHVKNFAFRMDHAGEWSLAPAYDLVYNPGPGGEHQMTVDGVGRDPGRTDCLRLAERHGVTSREAAAIFDQVAAALDGFQEVARHAGCAEATIERVRGAIRAL